ncbi:hypothetical protein E2C01_075255 [Portunus trituberculatus]|uniref:Uncharacterized protein n=1 Tax=Portunus trituberculatus TaxID=210409 RepID=A0A5B7IFQ2_PORTR|nr:hypothetical protein [Portunus trituberculatus]
MLITTAVDLMLILTAFTMPS